jgi:tetratricopeptide (TPR) repeat protein
MGMAPLPSDFPMALGSLDESDLPVVSADLPAAKPAPPPVPKAPAPPPLRAPEPPSPRPDLDLPVVAAGLPAARRAPPPATRAGEGARGASGPTRPFDLDLPSPAAALPSARRRDDLVDLPVVAAGLPAPAVGLPVVAAGLPTAAASLPAVAAGLPTAAASLPAVGASLPNPAASLPVHIESLPTAVANSPGFGEIELPTGSDSVSGTAAASPSLGSFGEIDLPREPPSSVPPLRAASSVPPASISVPPQESADFGDLQLDDKRRPSSPVTPIARSDPPATRSDPSRAEGGMSFGEVDFGGGHSGGPGGEMSIGVEPAQGGVSLEASLPPPSMEAAATTQLPSAGRRRGLPEAEVAPRKRSMVKGLALAAIVLALVGGAALQLTPYGAYGYVYVGDVLHAADYQRSTVAAMSDVEKMLAADTYAAARAGTDAAVAAHARVPRARPLAAYAAVVDCSMTARFGADGSRPVRAKQLLAELPANQPVKYVDVARAAQAAADGDLDTARKALDAASRRDVGDPIQVQVALLQGGLELSARDGAAALAAFKRALQLSNDARAHFGLARAHDMMGDEANMKKEIEATLASSPGHPGALTLRARHKSGPADLTRAFADLATVLDGAARVNASPDELSVAYAAKAWLNLERGVASDARDAFAQAVQLNPRNAEALRGAGRLLLNEGRYAEALARFDTALQIEPNSPEVIANDAEAKIALERLADAKQQLVQARERFPRSLPVLLLLGKVEQHLGNSDAAEADLRAAIAQVDPKTSDAVLPYVKLSELLSARGRMGDARVTLDEARKKLPESSALERAFGEVSELQGDFDTAIARYRAALTQDPKDVAARFRLGAALRRTRKFDEAGAMLDSVAAVDKDYPGLSLERGLLFEESGDVEKAIDLFKGALAKAPDDPDLQLRVGSAYVAIGRPDDALPMLHKALEKRPASAEVHHYLGRAFMLKGGTSQVDAIRYLKRAVDLDPNRPEFHVYLAWAANDATPAQLELARDEIDKALALDKVNPEAYWQRGVLERMEGAIEDAIKDERHALELRPSRHEAHATLAECYEDRSDEGAALAEWAKAIAGDGNVTDTSGGVPHPYWRYRYGKLLMERAGHGAALAQLLPAVTTAEKMATRPGWLAPLEFLSAEALRASGRKADAVEHYRRFLDVAPVNSPDRLDAQKALAQLTGGR